MKKLLLLILIAVLAMSTVACEKFDDSGSLFDIGGYVKSFRQLFSKNEDAADTSTAETIESDSVSISVDEATEEVSITEDAAEETAEAIAEETTEEAEYEGSPDYADIDEYDNEYDAVDDFVDFPSSEIPPAPEYDNESDYDNNRLIIATGGLHLRSAPSKSGEKLELIPDGTVIASLGESNGWTFTYYNGSYGWCSSEFLFTPSYYDLEFLFSARVTAKNGIHLVTDKYIGSRNAFTTIPCDTIVYVYRIDGNQAFVSYNSIYGWCSTEYLSIYR